MGDYWQATVRVLQNDASPIVDKPKLVEKYLTKPPFRYLHDVITAVQRNTGFAPGLYSGEELDAKGIQDKDMKVKYLQKIMDVVAAVTGEPAPAKPLKIVAGMEPENTNLFLQQLGRACKISKGADAVQRVLAGGSPPTKATAQSPPEAPRPTLRPSSQQTTLEAGVEEGGLPGTQPPAGPLHPAAAEPGHRSKRDAGEVKAKSSRSKSKGEDAPPAPAEPPAPAPKSRSSKSSSKPAGGPPAAEDPTPQEPTPPARVPSPGGAPSTTQAPSGNESPMQRSLMRPQSARKAPPKLPTAAAAVPSSTSSATASPVRGVGGAGRRPPPEASKLGQAAFPVAVMAEGAAGDSDDDVEVVHEAAPVAIGLATVTGQGGVLVKNILDVQKDLQQAGKDAAGVGDGAGAGQGIILRRQGKPAAGAAGGTGGTPVRPQDTGAMREMVQKLCQSSHPLAKSMDYLQEDLENMTKEYRFWQVEKRMFADKLATEQRIAAAGEGHEGEARLADLDGQIKQVRDRILGVKGELLRHDETIARLLQMAVGR